MGVNARGLGVGVDAPVLEGCWGGLRAGDEVTEDRVPFLEIVSEPLGQGRVRGAMASSLVIKEVMSPETGSKRFYMPCLTLPTPLQLSALLKSTHRNHVSAAAHPSIR